VPTWEIFGDDLLWIEIYAGGVLLIATAAWVIFSRLPVSLLALFATVTVLVSGAFRPAGYNSDTENYFSYVYFLKFVSGFDIFFLTKLEPVHSGLILLLSDFRLWLVAENLLMVVGLFLAYRARSSPISFLILCAFVLTLSTSSMRYCSAIIFFYIFAAKSDSSIARAVRSTAILSCLHISMLFSGAMILQRRIAPIAISIVCVAIIFQNSLLVGWRPDNLYSEATSSGLKSLTVAVLPILYLMMRQRLNQSYFLMLYLIAFVSIFAVTSTVIFTFNRFLIMGAISVMVHQWDAVRTPESDIFDRGLVFLMVSVIVVLYLYSLPELYFSGRW
jgi:hypothetical protein